MKTNPANRLVSSCIRHMSTKPENINYEFILENEFARFKLWNHGFDGPFDQELGAVSNQLDKILSYSVYHTEPTIILLANLVSCLLMREFAHVGNERTRTELRKSLDHAVAIYPHIENTTWDTDSEETQESAIAQLRYIIDSLFELASPLNDELEQMNSTAIDHLMVFYKGLIIERFPNTPEYLIVRLAVGCRQYHESSHERKITFLRTEPPSTQNSVLAHETRAHVHTAVPSISLTGDSTIQQHKGSMAESESSSYSINTDKPAMPKRPDSVNGYICDHCYEHQDPTLMKGISMDRWREHVFSDIMPYMCIQKECSDGAKSFGSREDWINHLSSHKETNEPIMDLCPFCALKFKPSQSYYNTHVGYHLEEIRLLSLPDHDPEQAFHHGRGEPVSRKSSLAESKVSLNQQHKSREMKDKNISAWLFDDELYIVEQEPVMGDCVELSSISPVPEAEQSPVGAASDMSSEISSVEQKPTLQAKQWAVPKLLDMPGKKYLTNLKDQTTGISQEHTKEDVRNTLPSLPAGLRKIYHRLLTEIYNVEPATKACKVGVLRWMLYVQGCCSVELLRQAFPSGHRLSPSAVLESYGNLVVVSDGNPETLIFADVSVKQFLEELPEFSQRESHTSIAEACLTALISQPTSPSLLQYSTLNWATHLQLSSGGNRIEELWKEFLKPSPAYQAWGARIVKMDSNLCSMTDDKEVAPPFWVACYYRLYEVIIFLLHRANTRCWNNRLQTPLGHAAECGDSVVVQLLLDEGRVDINSKDWSGRTPLSWAASNGHQQVVQLLLEKDEGYMNSKDKTGRTPLSWAAFNGHQQVVQLLLVKDRVDINSKDMVGRTALSWAAYNGHQQVVQMVLEGGGEINSEDSTRRTPLSWAASSGHQQVVQLLLKGGGEINSRDRTRRTPLSWAASSGHQQVVQLLLKGRGEINSKDRTRRTPLSWAASNGHQQVVQLLLEGGGEINSEDMTRRTPLSWAASNGHQQVVQLLLEKDRVDTNSEDMVGRTALSRAASNGHQQVVQLLIEKDGIDMNSKDRARRTPLSWASSNGHQQVVQLLLEKDQVDINSIDMVGRTALSWAAYNGHQQVVQLLLEKKKVDMN